MFWRKKGNAKILRSCMYCSFMDSWIMIGSSSHGTHIITTMLPNCTMKNSMILPLAVLAASISGTAADEKLASVGVGDWTDAFKCTADMATNPQQPTIIDQATCATTKDAKGADCLWCDSTSTLGTGLCLTPDAKAMAGTFWDQICASSSVPGPPANNPPTPPPVPPPTPPPVAPPSPDVPDQMKCSIDASGQVIGDETTCEGIDDPTTPGSKCAWCELPIVGGWCITSSMKSQLSFLCSSKEEEKNGARSEDNHLRGAAINDNGGAKMLDPSCLGEKDGCSSRSDMNGNACIWCDAGDDVFGVCATPDQKEYLGEYLSCEDAGDVDSPDGLVAAVE